MDDPASMTSGRWQRLQELFEQALPLPAAAREPFLAEACGDDLRLRDQVLSLLEASVHDDRLEARVAGAIASSATRREELQAGHAIGRYTIARLLGRGGMGAVYLAQRADREFDQQVAIKVVAHGVLSSRIFSQLRSERQILANLAHPNIARLLDGGTTDDGTPYLVMEYVEGRRIDLYCREQRLDLRARLHLFRQVCAAVAYAHSQLVIHRDIKPSNILVGDDGSPKLLDFGIAKLSDPDAESFGVTAFHDRVLTPEHASPEQLRGEQVGTASDVYALGLLLYELLAGAKPFALQGLSLQQAEKIVCEQVPQKPSAAAQERDSAEALRGDLDTIVMKAVHKDAGQRYASVSALSEDIQSYLDNRPITARPDSLSYRAAKFVSRNRWPVASASIALAVVIGLTIFYTLRVMVERDRAAVEAVKSRQIADYLVGMFRAADPEQAQGESVTAVQLLDRGAEQLATRLADQLRVQADLASVIGESYESLGTAERARALYQRSLELRRQTGQEGTPQYAAALYDLASIQDALGDWQTAQSTFEQAIALQRQFPREPLPLARSLRHLGYLYFEQNRYQEALPPLEEALRLVEQHDAQFTETGAAVVGDLALVKQQLQDNPGAERLFRRSLEICERLFGKRHPQTMSSATDFGLFLRDIGRFREAYQILNEQLAMKRAVLGADHVRVGFHLTFVGSVLLRLGEYERAEQALNESIAIVEHALGRNHRRFGVAVRTLGQSELAQGQYVAAEKNLRLAREVEAKNLPAGNEQLYRTDVLIAQALRGQSKHAEADALVESALHFFEHASPDKPTGALWGEAGRMRLRQHRWSEAHDLFARGLAELASTGVVNVYTKMELLEGMAQAQLRTAATQEALSNSRMALDIATEEVRAAPAGRNALEALAVAKGVHGAVLFCTGQPAQARTLLAESHATLQRWRSASDPVVVTAAERLLRPACDST